MRTSECHIRRKVFSGLLFELVNLLLRRMPTFMETNHDHAKRIHDGFIVIWIARRIFPVIWLGKNLCRYGIILICICRYRIILTCIYGQ